jgi:CrcB protein
MTPRSESLGRPTATVIAVVAAGGALGASGRYGLTLLWPTPNGSFPWATLVVNVLGCVAIGALMTAIETRIAPHPLVRPFVGTGVLGGFTTFSTYAVEGRTLLTGDHPWLGVGYLVGTLVAALGAVLVGEALAQWTRRRPTATGPTKIDDALSAPDGIGSPEVHK